MSRRIVNSRQMRGWFWLCMLLAFSAEARTGMHPGVSRWKIKTSVPEHAAEGRPHTVKLTDLLKLVDPSDVKKNDKRYDETLIPAFDNALHLKEGDLVRVTGWLHLVAFEDDGDYHIQISGSKEDGNHCLIVEVPMPDEQYVTNGHLREQCAKVRDFIKERMLNGKEPSAGGNIMTHPVHVTIEGQLFYDDAHVHDANLRGKKGMHAATLWEIHPITKIGFASRKAE